MATVKGIAVGLLVLSPLIAGRMASAQEVAAFQWQRSDPDEEGVSSAKLDTLKDDLAGRNTASFLVIRNDRIVYEWYAKGRSATDKHGTASLAKAIVGGMMLAVALHDGRVRLDDPVSRFIPRWGTDPRKSLVTVRQLGSHTSGLDDAESNGLSHDQLPGWMGISGSGSTRRTTRSRSRTTRSRCSSSPAHGSVTATLASGYCRMSSRRP